jgi:hypothetical protein
MALGTRLSALFFGQTHRNIHTRISEHRGVSALTGNHLATSIAILAHKNLQKHPVAESDFKAYKFPKLTLSLMLILDLLLSSYSNDNINFQLLTNYVTLTGHFLRIRQWGGGHLQKGTILYRVWRNDRWFVGNKTFGVVSHLIVGGGV